MFDPDYDIFAEIVSAGSISAAARQRNLSPASLSKRLARLEDRLGTRLLHRSTRRLHPTAAGKRLFDTIRAVGHALTDAENDILGMGSVISGPLRVTAPTSFGRVHLARCVVEFLQKHSQITLTLDLTDQFVDLLDDTYDLAVRISPGVSKSLAAHRFATSRRVLCAAPSYLEAHASPTTLADLSRHHLLAAAGQLPWQLDGPQGNVSVPGISIVQTNSSEIVRELALAGCGIALRSLWDVASHLDEGRLRRVLPEYQGSHDVGIFAVHVHTPRLPGNVRALIDFLADYFRDRPEMSAEVRHSSVRTPKADPTWTNA